MIKNKTSKYFFNFLETALYYAVQGYAIFPLKPRSKEPATPHGFKDATSNREQITSWWTQEPSYNIGIATGNMSCVLVIDVDGIEGEQSLIELEDKLGKLPETVTQITPGKIKNGQHTGRGRHLIFKTNGLPFSSRTGITKNIDIKADGGYIVAAPSVHPDGTGVYEFAEGFSLNDIEPAELPDTWREFLHGFERPKKQGMVPTLPPASEAIVEACRQEIACYEPAIENEGGDKQTFTVACTIFYDWGLSEAEGKPILEEYNARCVPPWNEKQLQHKIDSAIDHTGEQARGWKRTERPIEGEYFPPFGAVVLNPNRTLPSALAFRRAQYNHREGFTLWFYAGEFYCWTGSHYQQVTEESIKGAVLNWLTKAVMLKNDKAVSFPANSRTVNDVVSALKSVCLLSENTESGTWLGNNEVPPTSSLVFAQNCVYNWQTDEQYACSPCWFNLSCLNTTIENNVSEPKRWIRFLRELWDDDQQSKDLLHEFMGLSLTLDTSFQKMLLLSGPPRAGKGTIFRLLTAIHGQASVATPTTASLVQNFGLQSLLGKPLAIISDARFTGRDIQIAIERLLNISGEDSVVIDKKHRDPVTVKLSTRILIGSNEIPRLPDNAGALANWFLSLQLTRSFLGQEDRNLDSDLQNELPGILKLMLDGLRRLHLQGVTHTDYQTTFIQELEELGSPIRTFVRENCVLQPEKHISALVLWKAWQKWCEDYSHPSGYQSVFGRNLKSCFSAITKKRKEGDYCYFGIGLKQTATPLGLRVYHPLNTDRAVNVTEQMVQ